MTMLSKHVCGCLLAWAVILAGAGNAVADGATPPPSNTMCPVLPEEAVDPAISVEYEGKRVFLCCNRCRKKFLENPEAYLGNLPQFAALTPGAEDGEHNGSHDHAEASGGHLDDQTHGASDAGESPHAEEDAAHDHATGHGVPEGSQKLVRFLGKFHPVVVHFPIALVLAGLLAEMLLIVTGRPLFADAARFCVVLAALSAAVTVGLGWAAGAFANYPGDLAQTLWLHRWLGTCTGGLIIVAAILSEASRRPDAKRHWLMFYRVLLLAISASVGLTGHLGATLIYGFDYFTW